jgi:hypothetical protein
VAALPDLLPLRPHEDEHERIRLGLELVTPAVVAVLFKVHPLTVTRWAVLGRIGSVRTLGGHTRYKEAEVLRLLYEATQAAGPPGTVLS